MLKRILKVVLSRTFIFAILALLQIGFFVFLVYSFANVGVAAYTVLSIISVLVIIMVFEQDELNPAYRLMWLLIVFLLSFSGALFYLMWGHRHVPKRQRKVFLEVESRANEVLQQDPSIIEALKEQDRNSYQSSYYLLKNNFSPVYAGNDVKYYPIGDAFYPDFIEALKGAEKFIFMQYFIVEEGQMLDEVLEILREKAAQGVDVRFIWDGFGSLFTLPRGYEEKLREYGIRCYIFSPLEFTPHLSDYSMLNHRDHRKITVVDGEIAFSGGLNIADEYINLKERFGLWKDTAFRIKGQAAYSLTVTFLRTWDFVSGSETEFYQYAPSLPMPQPGDLTLQKGYVQPYWDSPLDEENVSANAYLNVIRHATDYVYISTPYLILDFEMMTALTLAAKSGVDVRILTPGIPDKPMIYMLTRSNYPALLRGGVRIYEYTPGFNHAKMYVSDDRVALVGSVNMDYRSLYLHFENGACFYGGNIVAQTKQDMLECFAQSKEIHWEDTQNKPVWVRIVQMVIRIFSPLL